ncbi:peptide/nickel transport system substrate-binding protein [Marinospirillum celere]|uniref:Peptide/nickel transport system substrate-binding protein n=1 Tax=Marinospirillum celere TaxID=1122252 RepID=A0A1I1G787_9GAMM|nr:ABC transporter substrate-binding protein [Marinospirillum celere]SFC07202.1 peptide/nickel transport system substrate-binding protein [Marinospirillum celere]
MRKMVRAVTLGTALTLMSAGLSAQTLRWASAGDSLTLDPHSQNHGQTHAVSHQIYNPLVYLDMDSEMQPGLAVSWDVTDDPNVWEFKLREGVTFHDGSPFTAEDVVFSFQRAQHANSDMRPLISSVTRVEAVDDHTVHIHTDGPTPLLPNNLNDLFIMSKSWSEEHNVMTPQDYSAGEENHAVRNANGTGPFQLVSRDPDVRTELVRNDDYWGKDEFPLAISRVIYTPIQSSPTRAAALLSGEIDFLQDVPVQDINRLSRANNVKMLTGPENRTIFFGMDQGRDELRTSNIQGENPFADRRVREAMNIAINREAIQQVVMRGQSVPAGMIAPSFVNGYTEALDSVPETDVNRARELLASAGYPDGFRVTLTCTNDRYTNDEAICQAVTGMLGQIGIDVRLDARANSIHFAELQQAELDFYILGWSVPPLDSHYVFDFLLETKTPDTGAWNFTGWSNEEFDALSRALPTETDLDERDRKIARAWEIVQEEIVYLPVHHQVLNWAVREDIDFTVQSQNKPMLKYLNFN